MTSRLRFWNRLPIRRKLAMTMAAQSLALLSLAFGVLYGVGLSIESDRTATALRAQAAFLSAVIAPVLRDAWQPGEALPPATLQRLTVTLESALKHDPALQQITLFGRRPGGFGELALFTLQADTSALRRMPQLAARNADLTEALATPKIDAQFRTGNDVEIVTAYAPVKGPNGEARAVLSLDVARADILQRIDYFKPVLGLGLVTGALLSLLLAGWLSRPFTQPVDRLARATEAVAQGDLNVQVPAHGADEFGLLSESFNRMTATVRQSREELEDNNRQLDLLNRQLRDTMVELEQVNSDLAESRNFFSTLVARTPSPIVVTDPDSRILLFNEAAQDLFGWRADEIVGETFDRIYSQGNRPTVRDQLDMQIHRGKVWNGEFLGRTRTGQEPLLEATVSPVRDDHGTILAFMYLAQDITETRQLQNLIIQMERMWTRGEMAGEIAHEINNYLTILGGNLDVIPMLLAQGNQEKLERKFDAMKEVLEKIARFSDGLMGYNDTETKRIQCDINRLIESLVGFLKPQNRYDEIHLQLELQEGLPALHVDVGQLQQVLVNLLNNAADSIHDHNRAEGVIEIATLWDREGSRVEIHVRDNGGGIPAHVVTKLFRERYTSKSRGHGLGLLNCRRIIESHRGRLEVESQEGNGATFTVTLPADEVTEVLPPPLVRSSSDT
jgi:PAS domain S-box-containing protein